MADDRRPFAASDDPPPRRPRGQRARAAPAVCNSWTARSAAGLCLPRPMASGLAAIAASAASIPAAASSTPRAATTRQPRQNSCLSRESLLFSLSLAAFNDEDTFFPFHFLNARKFLTIIEPHFSRKIREIRINVYLVKNIDIDGMNTTMKNCVKKRKFVFSP